MPAGPRYTPAEDARIAKAVEAGARTEADFRALAREIGRPALTLRHRAIKLDLIQPIRRGARAPEPEPKTKRGTAFSAEEDAFLLRARARGMTSVSYPPLTLPPKREVSIPGGPVTLNTKTTTCRHRHCSHTIDEAADTIVSYL